MMKINIAFSFLQQIGDDYATKTMKNIKENWGFRKN